MASAVSVLEKTTRPRGRPRSFVTADVVSKIRACFALRGYGGTSISDLAEATGLAPPSLYNAFGDKKNMFVQALEAEYSELLGRLAQLDHAKPLPIQIADFLAIALVGYTDRPNSGAPGIAFGAAISEAPCDAEIRSRLKRFHSELDLAAERILEQGGDASMGYLLTALVVSLCVGAHSAERALLDIDVQALSVLLSKG